jgi:hypothetical protein
MPNPNETLDSAMDKLSRADRLECTANLTFEEARAILQKLEMLQDTIDEYRYNKNNK